MRMSRFQTVLACALLGFAYFVLGRLGLELALDHRSATAVWPPSGLSLAAMLVLGKRVWPGVILGALAVNLTVSGPLGTVAAIAAGNTLEVVLSAFLVNRFAGGTHALNQPKTVLRFLLLGPVCSTTVAATIGVSALALGGQMGEARFGAVWLTWWLGDAVSQIVLTPLLLSWNAVIRPRLTWARGFEALLLIAGVFVTGQLIFGGWFPKGYPITFITIPVVLWAAFRFFQVGAATAGFLISVIAITGTLWGYGPFSSMSPPAALLVLQTFMGCVTVTGLITAALVSERLRAGEAVARLNLDLERRVTERTRALQEAVDELNAFAYSVAHDLRAPLRAMSGFSQLIAEDPALSSDTKDYAGRIVAAASRMDELIQDLLAYGKLSREAIDSQAIDTNGLVTRILQDMNGDLEKRKADVKVEGPLLGVKGHAVTLAQVVTNLLSNAVKFVAPGMAPRVRIRTQRRDGDVRLWVEDNGIGIALEHHERVFHVFERLHREDQYPGTGIGLAIVRRGMERMGGRSGVESKAGEGSRFWVELPAA